MGSRVKRGLTAVVGVSVALLVGALPASAEPTTGKVSGASNGFKVNLAGGEEFQTRLFTLSLEGGSTKLQAYCVEIKYRISDTRTMAETPWDGFPNAESPFRTNKDKINWVLHHSFPVVDETKLAKTLTDKGATLHGGLSDKEAITATQAAVWHFSDGKDLDKANPLGDGNADSAADVVALYEYLTGKDNVGIGKAPTPSLGISPASAKGEIGKLVGPFTVSTTGEIVDLKKDLPEGVKLTDKDGTELDAKSIKNGTEVFLSVPEGAQPGQGTFQLTASAPVATGRLFVVENYDREKAQSVIVAQSERSKVTASAQGSWEVAAPPTTTSPAPQAGNAPALAATGVSIFVPIALGVVLLGAGAGALLYLRRRRA